MHREKKKVVGFFLLVFESGIGFLKTTTLLIGLLWRVCFMFIIFFVVVGCCAFDSALEKERTSNRAPLNRSFRNVVGLLFSIFDYGLVARARLPVPDAVQ